MKFFFLAGVLPFSMIALFGPWIRDRKWTRIAVGSAIIFAFAAYFIQADGRYTFPSVLFRSFIISLIPVAGGWAYARWELSKRDRDLGG